MSLVEDYKKLLVKFFERRNETFTGNNISSVVHVQLFMQINGKHILWSHLISLYESSRAESGLYIGHKLKLEHIKLTSYSRMSVSLAAQVSFL